MTHAVELLTVARARPRRCETEQTKFSRAAALSVYYGVRAVRGSRASRPNINAQSRVAFAVAAMSSSPPITPVRTPGYSCV